jgi:hypothetical protein
MSNLPAKYFTEQVEALILDWKGQDEMFQHNKSQLTIYWYCGKVKSLEEVLKHADIRRKQTEFMEAAAQGYGIQLRRLQEAREIYKRFYHPSDSLKETVERIFAECGTWSKALPAKAEKVAEEACCHKCPIHP